LITIFTIPKPFLGLDDIHQRNAIQSWLAIRPECEIILCGNDQGVADAAEEYGVVHIPDIPVNEFGTPYLDAAFQRAQQIAKTDLMCYVNADIIFPPELVHAIEKVAFESYLLVGRRYDLDIRDVVDFHSTNASEEFFRNAKDKALVFAMGGSDYFFFYKWSLGELPEFTVGRPYWDNWMIYNARQKKLPVVDATLAILAIHQKHGYSHVQKNRGGTYNGPEGDINYELLGPLRRFELWDATHFLDNKSKIHKVRGDNYLKRKIQTLSVLKPRKGLMGKWQAFVQRALMSLYYRRKKIPYTLLEFTVDTLSNLC